MNCFYRLWGNGLSAGSWQSSSGGWCRGEDVLQAMRKAPLSRALAKSREERKRDEVRDVDKRQAAQGSNTWFTKYDVF